MFEIIATLSTNLFRTFIIRKFMSVFFMQNVEEKWKEKVTYFLFFLLTASVYLLFHFPPANVVVNILLIYLIAQLYEGNQKKKILAALLIYGINMFCDILSMYSFNNYVVGESYNEIVAYITVFLIWICEFIIEKFLVKSKKNDSIPPYWNILLIVPMISIVLLLILIMNNLNNRIILVSVSAGILFINLIIFYLYDALTVAYLKLEESALFERQVVSYSNQLNVLMQSEEKVKSLRHDLKHHLNELLVMADRKKIEEITDYIHNMKIYMDNPQEYIGSGNKEIDSLLNYMLNKAKQNLNKIEYKVNIPKKIDIKMFDLNVILGNLLDNAILAASQSESKWILVSINYEKGMLFIHVANSYEQEIHKLDDRDITTKKEAEEHGIGLKNVKRVVESYKGTMQILDEDKIFDVKIMLYTLGIE